MIRPLTLLLIILLIYLNAFGQSPNLDISGSLRVGGYYYGEFEDQTRIPGSGYLLSGNVRLRLGDLSIPISAHINDQGVQYTHPFRRIGLSPTYKAFTVHAGHRNLFFSEFSLNRRTIFGLGGEVNWKKLRLAYFRGKLTQNTSFIEGYAREPQFDRQGWAAKLGFGTEKNFIDLVIFSAADDSTSLFEFSEIDSLRILPEQNAVLGLRSQWQLAPSLSFELDGAYSGVTRDLRRSSLIPDHDNEALGRIISSFNFNETSHLDYAGLARMSYTTQRFFADIQFRRVMPGFESMGIRYMIPDQETWTINPGWMFSNGRHTISSSIGIMRNNLNEFKVSSTKRLIGSLQLNGRIGSNWNYMVQYGNYSITQQVLVDEITYDSILVEQVSHQFSVTPTYWKRGKDWHFRTHLHALYQVSDDNGFSNQQNQFVNMNMGIYLKNVHSGWSYQINPRWFSFESDAFISERLSLGMTIRKNWNPKRIELQGNYIISRVSNGSGAHSEHNLNLRSDVRILKKLNLGFQMGYFQQIGKEDARKSLRLESFLRSHF